MGRTPCSESSQVQPNHYTESWAEIINQGFVTASTEIDETNPLFSQRPPLPQKPKITYEN